MSRWVRLETKTLFSRRVLSCCPEHTPPGDSRRECRSSVRMELFKQRWLHRCPRFYLVSWVFVCRQMPPSFVGEGSSTGTDHISLLEDKLKRKEDSKKLSEAFINTEATWTTGGAPWLRRREQSRSHRHTAIIRLFDAEWNASRFIVAQRGYIKMKSRKVCLRNCCHKAENCEGTRSYD